MIRLHRVPLIATLLLLIGSLTGSGVHAQTANTLTFEDGVALWTVAIKPDRTADFEAIMAKLRQALQESAKPERRAQAAGWKVMKISKPLPDGTIAYVHIINPVVSGADYTILQALYDEFPNERQTLYDLYRGAFAKNLSMATGDVVVDMQSSVEGSSH